MAILNDLIVTGPSKLLGNLNVSSPVEINGPLNVTEDVAIGGNTEISGYLEVSGNCYFNSKVSLVANNYEDSYTGGALDLNNSNIEGVNAIYMANVSDSASEGIHFYKDASTVHSLYCNSGGSFIYQVNRPLGGAGTTVLSVSAEGQLSTRSLVISATDGGSWTASISSAGAVSAASYNAYSDRRLKENLRTCKLTNSNKSILDLPIYKFDFINGLKDQIGCMAQDLQEICPELVNEDNNGYLSILESKIVYLLLEEVKKLRQEVNELKNK